MLNTIVFFTSRLPSLDCPHTFFSPLRVYKQLLTLLIDGTQLKILQQLYRARNGYYVEMYFSLLFYCIL